MAELKEFVPEIDLELWPNFRHLAPGAKRESAPEPAPERIGQWKSAEGRPPDFVGVGTSDSNFPWWHELLLQHPSIAPPAKGHSLEFFSKFCKRAMTEEDVHAYHARFERPDGTLVGEWSPDYMYDIWTPMLLHRAAPDARLLVMLVDPVERFRLMIANSWQRRSAKERTNNRAAETDFLSNSVPRGRYLSQLRNLYDFYPRDRVLVLQYERCVKDPAAEYRTHAPLPRRRRRLPAGQVPRQPAAAHPPDARRRPPPPQGEAAAQVAAEALAGRRDPAARRARA